MVLFLERTLLEGRDKEGNSLPGTRERVMKIAEGLGNIGPEAKQAVPLLGKVLLDGITEQQPEFLCEDDIFPVYPVVAYIHPDWTSAEALGKIGTKEAYSVLSKAAHSRRDGRVRAVRYADWATWPEVMGI